MNRKKAKDCLMVRAFPQKSWGGAPSGVSLEYPNDRSSELKHEEATL